MYDFLYDLPNAYEQVIVQALHTFIVEQQERKEEFPDEDHSERDFQIKAASDMYELAINPEADLYTVAGMYLYNMQPYSGCVIAEYPEGAVRAMLEEMAEENDIPTEGVDFQAMPLQELCDVMDFQVVTVYKGYSAELDPTMD